MDFKTKLIKTDVTCVKLFKGYVLSGIGGCLHVFDLKTKDLIHKEIIFEGLKIMCIRIDDTARRILFTAENQLKVFQIDFDDLKFETIAERELNDWILDARWISTGIATVTMHNKVEFWDESLSEVKSTECEENCILYCALISCLGGEMVVLAGTVFSEILIWKPVIAEKICPVWKRLSGHNGVLFSIDHDSSRKIISSTSDDRSTIIWNYEGDFENTKTRVLLGHTARCFRSKITGNFVISAGEDGIVNVWNAKNGARERTMSAHQEASIWSLDADYERNILITGGGDSGVSVFNITPVVLRSNLGSLPENAVPKRVGVLSNGDVVLIAENGGLFLWKDLCKEWVLISLREDLKSYSLLEVSLCRKQIALAGFHGNIYVYKQSNGDLILDAAFETKSKSRIFSLHWLNCDTFLTCELNGLLYLRRKQLLLDVFELPPIKERWTTCACLCQGAILVGDRKGNVHVYNLGIFKPVQSIKKAHNYLGVTSLSYIEGIVTTLGRDSTIRRYKFITSNSVRNLTQISEDKVPFSWLTSLDESGILMAFNGSQVVFWDYRSRRTVLETECGGGHRSSDFLNKPKTAIFIYIKDKTAHRVCFDWESNRAIDLTTGINACSEINALSCLREEEKFILFTGGEDTTLRVGEVECGKNFMYNDEKCGFNYSQKHVLKSHLSSVRCLHLKNPFLFTAGGRGQILMWGVENNGNCTQLASHYEQLNEDEGEVRVMDLTTCLRGNYLYLLAACSDGKIKIFTVGTNKFSYTDYFQYERRCILKISLINSLLLISMATDGFLTFWNFKEKCVCVKFKAHKSGINSFSHAETQSKTHLILTGGDDNALTLSEYRIINFEITRLRSFTNSNSHCAQITGVYLSPRGFVFSAGLDKRVLVFEFTNSGNDSFGMSCIGAYETSVSDVKGLVVNEHKGFEVVLYGLGLEILHVVEVANKIL